MRLWVCYIFPPLGPLLCGKPFTAILTFILTLFGWYPGVQHALFVVNNHFQDGRVKKELGAINQPKWVKDMMKKTPRLPAPVPNCYLSSPPPQSWGGPNATVNDPTVGANGTRFRRKS